MAAASTRGSAEELRRDLAEARTAIAQERQRWSSLFQLAPVAFLVTDRFGVVREANEAAEQLFAVAAADLVGKPLAAIAAEIPLAAVVADASRDVRRMELAIHRRGGPSLRVEVAVRLLDPLAAGAGDELAWGFVDVEEREAAREHLRSLAEELEILMAARTAELERERALLATVLAQMPVGVAIAEAPSGRIVGANDHLTRLLGEDVAAASVAEYDRLAGYLPDGTRLRVEDWPLARALRGEAVTERLNLERHDNTTLVLDVSAAPIRDREGHVVYAVGVTRDATEQARRERAERDFVTNAAHELRTPLTAIISAAEVLDQGAKEIPEDRDRFLMHLRRECDRLAGLVQAMLTLARAHAGGEEPPAERVELRPLLDGIALSLHPASGVEVRVDCPAGLAAFANPLLLEQAVAGLGGNAAKYSPAGTIWLRARRLSGGALGIEVADEGPGVPPDEGERVFERFYRGVDRDRGGFGLGLAIVREAVEALGGQVELQPRKGGGTCARIVLPGESR